MNSAVLDQKKIYQEVNSVTGSVCSVLFGTKDLSELPVAELVQDFGLNISVCNRSVESAVLQDAFDLLDECVYALRPRKVFLNFGDTDLQRPNFDLPAFIEDYHRLIDQIHAHLQCRVFLLPVLADAPDARSLNTALARLAQDTASGFVDTTDVFAHEKPHVRLFGELIHYMRESRVGFAGGAGF